MHTGGKKACVVLRACMRCAPVVRAQAPNARFGARPVCLACEAGGAYMRIACETTAVLDFDRHRRFLGRRNGCGVQLRALLPKAPAAYSAWHGAGHVGGLVGNRPK
jgi:hypothetical protein